MPQSGARDGSPLRPASEATWPARRSPHSPSPSRYSPHSPRAWKRTAQTGRVRPCPTGCCTCRGPACAPYASATTLTPCGARPSTVIRLTSVRTSAWASGAASSSVWIPPGRTPGTESASACGPSSWPGTPRPRTESSPHRWRCSPSPLSPREYHRLLHYSNAKQTPVYLPLHIL